MGRTRDCHQKPREASRSAAHRSREEVVLSYRSCGRSAPLRHPLRKPHARPTPPKPLRRLLLTVAPSVLSLGSSSLFIAGLLHFNGDLQHRSSHASASSGVTGHLHAAVLDLAQFARITLLLYILFFGNGASSSRVCNSSKRSLIGPSSVYCSSAARARVLRRIEARDW